MGSGTCGKYIRSKGSSNIVPSFALLHSNRGTFKTSFDEKNKPHQRIISGGHGQESINFFKKNNIEYHIVKTLKNGVRLGNIPNHMKPFERKGTNHTWFPVKWKEKNIKKAGNYVAKLKKNISLNDGQIGYGTYKGVSVGIIKRDSKIVSIFPNRQQNIRRLKKYGKHK